MGAVMYSVLCGEERVPYLTEADLCCNDGDLNTLASLIVTRSLHWPEEVVEVTHKATRDLVERLLCQDAYQRPSLEQVSG